MNSLKKILFTVGTGFCIASPLLHAETNHPIQSYKNISLPGENYTFSKEPIISSLFVGGASIGYSKPSGTESAFNIFDFNPIFLFSYDDLMLMRTSVDFAYDNQGNTETSLDFMNFNFFLNDYLIFGVGKFDTGFGYFVQNLSPSWINLLPTSPVGFEGDEAAPQSDLGIQMRGGAPVFTESKINYYLFLINGPRGYVDATAGTIDHISTDGFTSNYGNYVAGGRLGFLPIPKLEIGLSATGGKMVLLDSADNTTVLMNGRNYSALGADFSYKWNNFDLRAEFLQQQANAQTNSVVPEAKRWRAWYLQTAYRIPTTRWEPVIRYGNFTSPVSEQQQRQWAVGVDYWIAPAIALQAAYDINTGQPGSGNDSNLYQLQLVYGF